MCLNNQTLAIVWILFVSGIYASTKQNNITYYRKKTLNAFLGRKLRPALLKRLFCIAVKRLAPQNHQTELPVMTLQEFYRQKNKSSWRKGRGSFQRKYICYHCNFLFTLLFVLVTTLQICMSALQCWQVFYIK